MEGRDEIADMLHAQLEHVKPSGFAIVGEANEADGVTDGWFDFETAVGTRPRSRPAAGRPVLDPADHDGRAEGLRGAAPHRPSEGHRARRRSRTARAGSSASRPAETALGSTEQPYAVIIGGGQGGIALGARLRQLDVPTIIIEKNARPGRLVAEPLQVAVPPRPRLVRPPAVHQVPGQLAGLLAEGQDRRLAGDVREGDGAQLLGLQPSASRRPTTRTPASGRSTSSVVATTGPPNRWC